MGIMAYLPLLPSCGKSGKRMIYRIFVLFLASVLGLPHYVRVLICGGRE